MLEVVAGGCILYRLDQGWRTAVNDPKWGKKNWGNEDSIDRNKIIYNVRFLFRHKFKITIKT